MTPLVRVVLGFAAGIVVGLRLDLPYGALVTACGALLVLSIVVLRGGRDAARSSSGGRRPGGRWLGSASRIARLSALFAALGLLAGTTASRGVRTDCRAALADGATIGVRGTLEGAPPTGGTTWLRLESLRIGSRETPCSGALRVRLPSRGAAPPVGDVLVGTGVWWAFPRSTSWPEAPERGGTLGLRSLRVADGGGGGNVFSAARGRAQERVRALFPRESGLAEALVLAERGGIDAEVKQDFAAAGLMHLLSISGTHVGLVALILLLVGSVLRLPLGWAAAAAAAATVAYVLFLGAPHAASRAALQIVLLLAARLAQRPSDPYTLLAFAALVLLVADPLAVLGAGFQLSFAGIYGCSR